MLLEDIKYAIAHLAKNPVPHSTAGPTFRHDRYRLLKGHTE
jgi:glutamate decarboxylase